MTNLLKKQWVNFFWNRYSFPILIILVISSSSCNMIKPSGYFKDIKRDTIISVTSFPDEELKIKKGDVLSISLSSLNKLEDELFGGKTDAIGFEVGKEGEIYLHRLGKVTVQGLTRKQLKAKLEEELKPYLKDPVAVVNFANHHITVIGEIGKPQQLPMPEERISIIDALSQSGGITQSIQLSNVMVIRDLADNKKLIKHLNLEDHSVFATDYFYLQPNDVVVLNSNEKIFEQEQKRMKYQQTSTLVLQTVTMALLLYQTFFRK